MPPFFTIEEESQGRSLVRPLTFRDWMYGASVAAPFARMEMSSPCGRLISMRSNSGEARVSSAREGTCGYMPSAEKTYQDDISPRSSLPGMPAGSVVQSCFMAALTVSWVL